MEIIGYKSFNKGLINRYGKKFLVGKIYISSGAIKFGLDGNGYHLCKNMEDTFRYFDAMNNEIDVCLVKGSGIYDEHFDDYYAYYDMYCVEKIEILKKLNRLEIIEQGLNLSEFGAERFVSSFKLNLEEIEMFKNRYKNYINVLQAIKYYQENKVNIYKKEY